MATTPVPGAATRIVVIAALALALCSVTVVTNQLQEHGSLSPSWLKAFSSGAPWPFLVAATCVAFALLAVLSRAWPSAVRGISLGALSAFSLLMLATGVLRFSAIPSVGYPVMWRESALHNLPLMLGLTVSWLAWLKWRSSGGNTQVLLVWWLSFFLLNAPLPAVWYATV